MDTNFLFVIYGTLWKPTFLKSPALQTDEHDKLFISVDRFSVDMDEPPNLLLQAPMFEHVLTRLNSLLSADKVSKSELLYF